MKLDTYNANCSCIFLNAINTGAHIDVLLKAFNMAFFIKVD